MAALGYNNGEDGLNMDNVVNECQRTEAVESIGNLNETEKQPLESQALIPSNESQEAKDSHRRRRQLSEKLVADLEDELACSVCMLLAVQPTTLVCGHTSCRVCLARWYFTSKKKACPLCRQTYHDLPQPNVQLGGMIHKLYPEKAMEREREVEGDDEVKDLLEKFDKELQGQQTPTNKTETDVASFCAGIIIAICCFIVVYLAWYWQLSDSNLLVLKPVQMWKPEEVAQWMTEMSWAEAYSNAALDFQVDGKMLLMMSEPDLEPVFNMTSNVHQKAFMFALDILRDEGIKMPANLWEYKALYPGRALFLVFSMKDFPRTSLLYMYIYFHDDMFIPFVRAVTASETNEEHQMRGQSEEISWAQWVTFFVHSLILPEWLVIIFAWNMFSHHFFTPMFVMATALLYQILEHMAWISLFQDFRPGTVYDFVKSYVRQLMSAFMFMVVWPIIPSLICDIFFYGALYISPVQASMAVWQKVIVLADL